MTANILDFASQAGADIATGLTFTSATFVRKVTEGRLEYGEVKLATADDLSAVAVGHRATAADFANAENNGDNMVILDVLADGIVVQMVERLNDSKDETGVSVDGNVTTTGAARKPLSVAHNAMGVMHREKLSAAHLNWIIRGLIVLVQNALTVYSNLTAWAAATRIASKMENVRGLGWLYYDVDSTEQAGDGVYSPDSGTGRAYTEAAHPDAANAALAAFIPEILPPVSAVPSSGAVTVPGAQIGDGVVLGAPSGFSGRAFGYVSATDTVTIDSTGGTTGTWSVTVMRPNSMPVISERGRKIYVNLIGGAYTGVTLETDLGIAANEAAFRSLVNSQQHRATIRLDAAIKAVVELSDTADEIMTETGGY